MIDTVISRDARDELGLSWRPLAEAVRLGAGAIREVGSVTRIPAVKRAVKRVGQRLLESALRRRLDGVAADYPQCWRLTYGHG